MTWRKRKPYSFHESVDEQNFFSPHLNDKNLKLNDEVMILCRMPTNGNLLAQFINSDGKHVSKDLHVPLADLSKFLDSDDCEHVKETIFNVTDLKNDGVKTLDLLFRQKVGDEFRRRNFPVHFVHPIMFSVPPILDDANVKSKPGEVVLSIKKNSGMVNVAELRRKPEGFEYIASRDIFNCSNKSVDDLTNEMLASCDPQYVTIFDSLDNRELLDSLKSRVASSKNVISIDLDDTCESVPHVVKTMFDSGHNKVLPFCMDTLAVTNETNLADFKEVLIAVEKGEQLPWKKIKVFPKEKKPYYIAFLNDESGKYEAACKAELMKENCHRIKLTLVVNRNSLPFLYQEPYIIPGIEALPKKLTSKTNLDVPVIGFYDNSSVICVHDENGYKFLETWNGMYGNDLYLSFKQKETAMVTDLNQVKDNDPFLVYDFIRILTLPPYIIVVDPKWGFKVTNDPENPMLLEYDNYDGTRKSSTPILLMAIVLMHHINVIEKETGKVPTQLAFCLFNKCNPDVRDRILNGLKEACKLLKIGFVAPDNF